MNNFNNTADPIALSFQEKALEMFRYQHQHNELYQQFCQLLKVNTKQVSQIIDIPFLPISFFKTHTVKTGNWNVETYFESSGTSGTINSRHTVQSVEVYLQNCLHIFQHFYGDINQWCILALLPAYAERQGSSLVAMANEMVKQSGHPKSGFYLYNHRELAQNLQELEQQGQRTLLLGVTFALLDFATAFPIKLTHTLVMETGGMKGRRKEIPRQEVHQILKAAFGSQAVHSEYGMTELFSQAYAAEKGRFYCAPGMQVLLREEDDPLALHAQPVLKSISGAINIIDLANRHSCAFIATDDAGRLNPDGSFEVLGRLDHSDIRGCSLLAL
jgi:hypothetical protein